MFAFGHGLNYTDFSLGQMVATPEADSARAEADATNTGARIGSTVVQIYVARCLPRCHGPSAR